jgi:hypothetical protein
VTVEEELAAALNTVPGVDAKAYRPDILDAGAAWPAWTSAMPLTDCSLDESFDCLIVLGDATPADTAQQRRRLIPLLAAALRDASCTVTGSGLVIIPTDPGNPAGGGPPGLRISVRVTTQEDT